jgi:hypothetical protein
MTAAEWFPSPTSTRFPQVTGVRTKKIPTRIKYGDENEVVSWGSPLQDDLSCETEFKAKFANLGNPEARTKAIKSYKDFLHHFCDYLIQDIVQREKIARQEPKTEWFITYPALWDEPIKNDFRMLVSDVLRKLLPGCKVFLDLTEALASYQFLAKDYLSGSTG